MTENEVTKILKGAYSLILQCRVSFENVHDYKEASEEAIKALEEVQEYRKLGTLEELARAREYIDLAKKHGTIGEMIDECAEYESIGTMEECREAVEKQRPKKSKDILKINPVIDGNGAYVDADTTVYLLCPNCEELVGIEENCDNYCRECGQKIGEESEEE